MSKDEEAAKAASFFYIGKFFELTDMKKTDRLKMNFRLKWFYIRKSDSIYSGI